MGPIAQADGCNLVGQFEEPVPSVAGSVEDGLVAVEDAVGEPVLPQELPEILDWIELGRARRQVDRDDVGGHLEAACGVPGRPVEQQHRTGTFGDTSCDDFEMGLHGLRVGGGQDESRPLVLGRTDGTEQEGAIVALILGLARPGAFARPQPGKAILLADPRFVLEPDLDGSVWAQVAGVSGERGGEVFLNAWMTASSWAGWRGLALMWAKPSSSSRRDTERSE